MTNTYTPGDVLRTVALFAELHHLAGDIMIVGPQRGTAVVTGYASALNDESAVGMVTRWARAIGVDNVDAHRGPDNYHLTAHGKVGSLPIGFTVLTHGRETEALDDEAITGDLTLDQLGHFMREPEAVSA